MDRTRVNIPKGFKVPDGYFNSVKANEHGSRIRSAPKGLEVPQGYFDRLTAGSLNTKAQSEGKVRKLNPYLAALVCTAAALACLIYLDNITTTRSYNWQDISEGSLKQRLLYSDLILEEVLKDEAMTDGLIFSMQSSFTPNDQKLEEELLYNIETLELWYDYQ